MGLFDNFWSSDKTSTSSSTYTPNVPQWYKDLQQSNLLGASDIAGRTPDQSVAGFTGDQNTAQGTYRDLLGSNSPLFQAASNTLLNAVQNGANVGPDSYKPYMSPYIENVINTANRDATEASDIQKQQIASNANMMNAFGSGRSDLAMSRANEALTKTITDNTTRGMQDAFTWANSQALENAKANIGNSVNLASGLTGLATGQTSDTLAQANALNASGTQQQQLDQAMLDSDKNNLTWLNSLTNAANTGIYGGTTTGTQTTPGAGWGSQLLGMGLSAAALASGNPMLMSGGAGGISSLFGGSPTISSTGGGAFGQGFSQFQDGTNVDWYGQRAKGFADGGLVQNYAGGGLVQNFAAGSDGPVRPMSMFDALYKQVTGERYRGSAIDKLNRYSPVGLAKSMFADPAAGTLGAATGGLPLYLLNKALGREKIATHHANTTKDMLKGSFSGPAGLVSGTANAGSSLLEGIANLGVPESVIQAETKRQAAQKAKELEAQQAAAQAQNDAKIQEQLDRDQAAAFEAANTPPPTPVQQVTETDVTPVVEETRLAANTDSETPLSERLKANTPEKPKINIPLLMAGLGMMSSDKPFFQAIGEGGMQGARALSEEQAREQAAASKLNEMLVELSKQNRQAATDATKLQLQAERNATYKDIANTQKRQHEDKIGEAKRSKDTLNDLQKQRSELNKQLSVEMVPANKAQMQSQIAELQKRIDELLRSGSVAAKPTNQVQLPNDSDFVDWSK